MPSNAKTCSSPVPEVNVTELPVSWDASMSMFRMMSLGVDGIITDEPAALLEVREAMEELGAAERLAVELALRLDLVPQAEEEVSDDLEGESELGPAVEWEPL